MASRRMIDPQIWQSETFAGLTLRQRLLFIGLFSNADDQGRLRGHPSLIRSMVFPYEDVSLADIKTDLAAIAGVESIVVYPVDGKDCIQIVKWWQYQAPQWAYPSKIEAHPLWTDRLRYRKNNQIQKQGWDTSGGFLSIEEIEAIVDDDITQEPNGRHLGDEIEDNSYTNLPKDLPKPLPKALGGPIVVELELDSTTTTTPENDTNLSLMMDLYENNIAVTVSPILADELKDYSARIKDPEWIRHAFKQAAAANVRKWNYVKAILDSCITAGRITEKPKRNGAQKNERANKTTSPRSRTAPTTFAKRKYASTGSST